MSRRPFETSPNARAWKQAPGSRPLGLASAVESIQDAFALFDEHDRLVLCNSVYRRLLAGVLPDALVGRHYEEVLDAWLADLEFANDDERAAFREERRSRRHEPKSEFNVRTRDGRSLRVIDRRTPEGGLVKTIWDLTDDARLAEELREARASRGGGERRQERVPLVDEPRAPHAAQRDPRLRPAPAARQEATPARAPSAKGRIRSSKGASTSCGSSTTSWTLSRIEARGVSISTEPVSVLDVLEELLTTLAPTAASAGIRLELDAFGRRPSDGRCRSTRFAQILMNFGSNAIKYNRPEGRVTFSVSAPNVLSVVRVTVSDTGMGIPEDKQDTLFQPFQRAGQETGPIEGTGIGLAITQAARGTDGGAAWAFAACYGEGSEFWVQMPVHSLARAIQPAARGSQRTAAIEARRARSCRRPLRGRQSRQREL